MVISFREEYETIIRMLSKVKSFLGKTLSGLKGFGEKKTYTLVQGKYITTGDPGPAYPSREGIID